MKNTKSLYTFIGAISKLKGGDFGFDVVNSKLFAGFGAQNREIVLYSDTGWITPTLTNGWEVYDEAVSYRKDSMGKLHFKGTARYGALNYAIFQLPLELRPTRNISVVVLMRDGFGRLDINTSGEVIPRGSEELEYDTSGNPTGNIIEVGYISMETGVMI